MKYINSILIFLLLMSCGQSNFDMNSKQETAKKAFKTQNQAGSNETVQKQNSTKSSENSIKDLSYEFKN